MIYVFMFGRPGPFCGCYVYLRYRRGLLVAVSYEYNWQAALNQQYLCHGGNMRNDICTGILP